MTLARLSAWTLVVILSLPATLAAEPIPAQERMKSCDAATAITAAHEILNDPATLNEPVAMFIPAYTLFRNGRKEDALFWYYAAQLRARYQIVFENGDRAQVMAAMMMTIGESISQFALLDFRNAQRTIDRVLAWDQSTPNAWRDRPHSAEQRAQLETVYSGLRELRAKLASEGQAFQQQLREIASQGALKPGVNRPNPCVRGELDPSLVKQQTEKEQEQVTELVRNSPEVVRAAGAINEAQVSSRRSPTGSSMPSHYTVYVRGQRDVLAEVSVTRSGGEPLFTVRCTYPASEGERSGREPCPQ
jgi:hypothetical protein